MNKENRIHNQRIYLDLGLIALLVLSLLGYSYYSSSRMTHIYAPLIDAIEDIKLEITTAHLWFEETLSGDRHESIDKVWQHLGQVGWYAEAILQGGESTEGTIIPVEDPHLRQQIQAFRDKLLTLRRLTEERYELRMTSAAGSDIDQQYDVLFSELLGLMDKIEEHLKEFIAGEVRVQRIIEGTLAFITLFLFVLAGVFFHRHERRQAEHAHLLEQEITERKQAEEALCESEQNMRLLLESSGESIYGIDLDGNCTFINPTSIKTLGYQDEDELLGRNMHTHIHHSKDDGTFYPEDECRIYRAFRKGENVRVDNEVFWRADGTCFPIEYRSSPIFKDNQIIGCVVNFIDITERKRALEVLSKSENRFRHMFENHPLGYQSLDEDGTFIDVNPAWLKLLGYDREDVIGRSFKEFLAPGYGEHFQENFANFKVYGEVNGVRFEMKRKDGSFIEVEYIGRIGYDVNGNFKQTHCVMYDITERKQAEEEKQQFERQLFQIQKLQSVGELTGGIAHKFNNILAAVMGYSTLATDKVRMIGDEKLSHYHEEIIRNCKGAKTLVEQMLTFSSGDGSRLKQVSVPEIVTDSVRMIRSILPTSIEIECEIGEEIPDILIVPEQLQQAILNFCINAQKAMPNETGTFSLRVVKRHLEEAGDQLRFYDMRYKDNRFEVCYCRGLELHVGDFVELSVADTGCGISEEVLSRMFEPFYTTREVGEGIGLGLAVAHGVMQRAGGHIIVVSDEGKGTEFRLLFKALKETGVKEVYGATLMDKSKPDSSPHIMVVDDEEPVLKFVTELLSDYGYRIRRCGNSEEALALFEEDPAGFDMILTDQTMAKLTGMELAERCLAIRPDIPVILYSSDHLHVDEAKAEAIGICGFLEKPVPPLRLLKEVSESLAKTH